MAKKTSKTSARHDRARPDSALPPNNRLSSGRAPNGKPARLGADATAAATTGASTLVSPASQAWTPDDPRFWQVASALLVVGITLRLWQLAAFPYHPDEAIHAWFADSLGTYRYDPIYHGPLLYHLIALVAAVLRGTNEFTARLISPLLGVGLMALVLGPARRWLGARGALWTLGLLAISPVLVTYQRRLLHDALVLMLTLGAVLCFQTALENPSHTRRGRRARVLLCVLLAMFVATKANAFFIIAMLASFWVATQIKKRLAPRFDAPPRTQTRAARPAEPAPHRLAGALWWVPLLVLLLVSVAAFFAKRTPEEMLARNEGLFSLACLLSMLALGVWLLTGPLIAPPNEAQGEPDAAENQSAPRRKFDLRTPLLAGWSSVFVFAFLFGHGYLWWKVPLEMVRHPATWALSFATSAGEIKDVALGRNAQQHLIAQADGKPPRLAIAEDWDDITGALPQMIAYWGGQQKKPRLPGPHDYYIVLMLLYELPIVIVALGGLVRACRQRAPFTDLLLWWAITSFALYALANEKMPWLLCHIILPLALLGGWWLGSLRFETRQSRRALKWSAALGALFLVRGAWATNFERAVDRREPMFYAQTSETWRDAFSQSLHRTANTSLETAPLWIDNTKQWPMVWLLRANGPDVNGASYTFGVPMDSTFLRMAVVSPQQWQTVRERFPGWKAVETNYYIWPRASWPALRPDVFARFWLTREATAENGVLAPPGEWPPPSVAVVASPP